EDGPDQRPRRVQPAVELPGHEGPGQQHRIGYEVRLRHGLCGPSGERIGPGDSTERPGRPRGRRRGWKHSVAGWAASPRPGKAAMTGAEGEPCVQFRFDATTIRITHPDAPSLLAEVAARLEAGRGFALATVNLDHLVKL